MSIENEIKKLRESIEGLTNAITESNKEKVEIRVSEPTPIKVRTKLEKEIKDAEEEGKEIAKIIKERKKEVQIKNPPKPLEYEVQIKNPPKPLEYNLNKLKEKSKITNDMVKQLGKEKMAAGVDRSKIKSIITSLAGPNASIADLDESNLKECYNKINELTA
tara:strand:+ start:2875 stop:3360 length:486 start_codon:yes stop_codon:yes gene_type:complete